LLGGAFLLLISACCASRGTVGETGDNRPRQYPIDENIPKTPGYTNVPKITDFRTAAKQFKEKVEKTTNPEKLRDWALKLLSAHRDETESVDLGVEELPDFLKRVDPTMYAPRVSIMVKPDYSEPYVLIHWGGGFAVWGLEVADQDFAPSNDQLYFIKWKPGVFIFHSKN